MGIECSRFWKAKFCKLMFYSRIARCNPRLHNSLSSKKSLHHSCTRLSEAFCVWAIWVWVSPADVSYVFFIVRCSQFNNRTLLQRQHITSSTPMSQHHQSIWWIWWTMHLSTDVWAKPTHLHPHCIDIVSLVELCLSEQTGLFQNFIKSKVIFLMEIDKEVNSWLGIKKKIYVQWKS